MRKKENMEGGREGGREGGKGEDLSLYISLYSPSFSSFPPSPLPPSIQVDLAPLLSSKPAIRGRQGEVYKPVIMVLEERRGARLPRREEGRKGGRDGGKEETHLPRLIGRGERPS